MKNLTQIKRNSKPSLLNRQQEKMLAQYQNADQPERTAIIRQIEAFLSIARNEEEKNFWLELREKLENSVRKQEK